jgi:hypothetical protein
VRFRYLLSLNIPITNELMSKNTFYFSAYNEIFLNAQSPVFDQDRVYGAVGYALLINTKDRTGRYDPAI